MDLTPWSIDVSHRRIVVAHGDAVSDHETVLDHAQVCSVSGAPLSDILLDLADLAVAAYFADRVCRRERSHWTRELCLRIPVRAVDRWSQPVVRTIVEDALNFYTGDRWNLAFTPAPKQGPRDVQEDLFPGLRFSPTRVALFSGGLDSLGGTCRDLVEGDDRILLVSGSTGPRLRGLQGDLSFDLAQRFAGRVASAIVKFGFANRARRADRHDENTQRVRGFVFAALGAVTAVSAGLRELSIYENGPGAINLPFTSRQRGVHLTRATNPLALRRMEAVIEVLTEQPFRFRLPFLFETKGALCNGIRDAGVEHLVAHTISCDGFPQRVEQQPQCGLCTSCLLRRMSLHAAGLTGRDARNYRVDVLHPGWSAPEEKLFPFRAMLYQASLLSAAVTSPVLWRALLTRFPDLLEIAVAQGDVSEFGGRFVDLYRRYCSEWEEFPARAGGYEAALAA